MKMSPEPLPEMLPSRPRPSEAQRHAGKATSITWPPTLKKMIALASVGRIWGGWDFVDGNDGRSGATYGRCESGAAAVLQSAVQGGDTGGLAGI